MLSLAGKRGRRRLSAAKDQILTEDNHHSTNQPLGSFQRPVRLAL